MSLQGAEVMGPAKWKRLMDAVSRRYRALLAVLRDPQGAKEKAAAAEAARCVVRAWYAHSGSALAHLRPSGQDRLARGSRSASSGISWELGQLPAPA